ncbi:hypothetical protein [Thalassobacillus hwangdonensis]|uniref:Uncharacterized protein n=1 Tax=Thalassobacillus hwangdonensis TaxID=546108 RepID=A0ABW3L149_9BACI
MNDFLMYSMILIAQMIGLSGGLAIFSSIFTRSRFKGILWLAFIAVLCIYQTINAFQLSEGLGLGIILVSVILLILAFFIQKKKSFSHT